MSIIFRARYRKNNYDANGPVYSKVLNSAIVESFGYIIKTLLLGTGVNCPWPMFLNLYAIK